MPCPLDSTKQVITKMDLSVIKKFFCSRNSKFKLYENILNIKFLEIQHPKLNHFNSDNFSGYINFGNNHYISSQCNQIKKLLDTLILKNTYIQRVNLREINSIDASRSKKIHDSIYCFGKNIYMKENINWTFTECIEHVLKTHKILHLNYYHWNNRYHWINSDGSHHFAVAQYISVNKSVTYFFNCKITSFRIDKKAIKDLTNNYELFLMHEKISYAFRLSKIFTKDKICILKHQQNCEVLIALTKDKLHSNRIINFLNKIDDKYIFNVNNYINTLMIKS